MPKTACPAFGYSCQALLNSMRRLVRDEFCGLVSCASLFILYVVLVPDYVLGGDNGEFIALARTGGIAHPPGYPLYLAYLRSLSWISANAAYATGLATSVLGGLQVLILYWCLRVWGMRVYSASLVTVFYGTSSLALYLNTHAEVFALNGLLAVSLLVLTGSRNAYLSPVVCAVLIGMLFGLGASNHHTIIFLAPVIVYSLVAAWRRSYGIRLRVLVLPGFIVGFSLGLAPYGFLFEWSHSFGANLLSWGIIDDASDLLNHFLRREYGTFSLGKHGSPLLIDKQLHWLGETCYWSWNILLPFALVSLLRDFRLFKIKDTDSWRWLALWLSIALSGPLFVSRFNIHLIAIVERFHALPMLLLSLPVAKGLEISIAFVRRRWLEVEDELSNYELSPFTRSVSVLALVAFVGMFNFLISERRMNDRVSRQVHILGLNALKSLPFNSMVLLHGDHQTFGFNALQHGLSVRLDVLAISPAMLNRWYLKRVERRLGGNLRDSRISGMVANIIRLADSKGVLVFSHPAWLASLPNVVSYQYGVMRRVVSSKDQVPSPERLYDLNRRIFMSYVPYDRRPGARSWSYISLHSYDLAWRLLADDLEKMGRADLAVLARDQRKQYGFCVSPKCD